MMVLQTIPLGHLGTAPLFVYAQTLCPKLCPMHPIFAYCPLIQSLQPVDTSRHLVKRGDLQTSPLGHLGTAPFLITQLLAATALPSTSDLLPNLLPNSDQVFSSPEFRKCCDTASAACLSAPRDR